MLPCLTEKLAGDLKLKFEMKPQNQSQVLPFGEALWLLRSHWPDCAQWGHGSFPGAGCPYGGQGELPGTVGTRVSELLAPAKSQGKYFPQWKREASKRSNRGEQGGGQAELGTSQARGKSQAAWVRTETLVSNTPPAVGTE